MHMPTKHEGSHGTDDNASQESPGPRWPEPNVQNSRLSETGISNLVTKLFANTYYT